MKPFDDEECKCHQIEDDINKENPGCNWNCDKCCAAWQERSTELVDNNIEFEPHADENYACTCPTCGNVICGWCV